MTYFEPRNLVVHSEDRSVRCEKKVRESPNLRKKLSHVILELHNVRMKPSNMRKKIREPPNVTKELSYVSKTE